MTAIEAAAVEPANQVDAFLAGNGTRDTVQRALRNYWAATTPPARSAWPTWTHHPTTSQAG